MLLRLLKRLGLLACTLFSLLFLNASALAQTPIASATFNNVTTGLTTSNYIATAPSDASGGISPNTTYRVNYGVTRNQFISNYTIGSTVYNNFVLPDTLIIQRTDAGRQLIIFYEYGSTNTAPNPDEINIQPEQQDNEDALYQSGLSNAGYDNILVNDATNFANVERVDVIYYSGVVTSTPANAVFPIVERNGNDDIRVAAIRGLDANGNPNDYFPNVVRIRDNDGDWGNLGVNHTSIVMRRQSATSDPLPQTILGTQVLHGTSIAFTEFGVSANEIVYGYSIFADDVTATGSDLVDFTNAANFPINTSETSGLDLIAGISTAVASDPNLRKATGPGGYKAALNTWLKANVGVTTATDGSTVTDWQDQYLGNHDATNLGTAPTYRNGTASGLQDINFNPTIDFLTATETGLQIADNTTFNTAASYQRKSINIAIRTGNDVSTKQQIYEQGGSTKGLNVYLRNGSLYVGAWNLTSDGQGSPWAFNSVSTSVATNTEYIVSIEFDGNNTVSGTMRVFLNGQSAGTISNVGLLFAHTDDIGIGDVDGTSLYDNGSSPAASFYGSIPEIIYCNEPAAFSSTQRRKIESYLALKYGITLNQSTPINYVNSDGTIIFNTTSNAASGGFLEYNRDIAGIGRDDASEFVQQASQSENAGSLVRMRRNAAIGLDNSWMIWGNDGGALTQTSVGVPDTVKLRLTRVWRLAESKNIGVVDVSFDINDLGIGSNPNNLSLLVASNSSGGNFSNANVITGGTISTIDGRTFVTFPNVDLSNGQYFTLGTDFNRCSPGGVETDLTIWYRADKGTNTTVNGADVTSWANQTQFTNNATEVNQGGTPQEPTYVTSAINFNPTVRFTDPGNTSNSYLKTASNPVSGDMTLISVFSTTQNQGNTSFTTSPALIGADVTASINDFGLGLSAGRVHAKIAAGIDLGTRSPSTPTYFDGQPRIATATRIRAASGALRLFINSQNVATGTSDNTALTGPTSIGIGNHSDPNVAAQFAGDIPEVIIYADDLTNDERTRVESYVAIKYGITRVDVDDAGTPSFDERDYRSAAGTVLWDYDVQGATFYNDIAGIGRDDSSCLEQRQSKSVNSDAIVTMGLGSIEASNLLNTNSFSNDNSFLLWGNNNASTTFAGRTTGVTGIGTVTQRMTRIWRADETANDVGNTSISFNLTGLGYTGSLSDYQLIVSNNSNLTSAALYQAASFTNNVVTFNGINLADGQYFTLGTARTQCGPGGVTTNLALWLRANSQVYNTGTTSATNGQSVSTWVNQTGGTNAVVANLGGGSPQPPLFASVDVNFNPSINFRDPGNNSASYLAVNTLPASSNITAISVFRTTQSEGSGSHDTSPVLIGASGGTGGGNSNDWSLGVVNGAPFFKAENGNNSLGATSATTRNNNLPYISTGVRISNSNPYTLYVNSASVATSNPGNTNLNNANSIGIGNHNDPSQTGAQFAGNIMETIIFSGGLNSDQQSLVESYLAIKYGITRLGVDNGSTPSIDERDYRSSAGTVLWDYDGQGTAYYNDIAGIGRDDGACFSQRQSRSVNTDDILTMGLGTIAASNSENPNGFADNNDFLLWGNNNGATTQAGALTTGLPNLIAQRMARTWRVDDNGAVGATQISFDLTGLGWGTDASDFRLMVASSASGGSMTSATLISGGSFNGSVLSFSGVDLTDGQYFTLGVLESCGPGGVNTNLALWLRADKEVFSNAGTTPAVNGNDVIQWNDQSSSNNNASEVDLGGGSPSEPTFRTNSINYNPSILFTDQNTTNSSYLRTGTNTVTGNMSLIAVFTTAQSQGSTSDFSQAPALIGANASGTNDYGMGLSEGRLYLNAANNSSLNLRSPAGTSYANGTPYIATGTRVQAASGALNLYVNSRNVASNTASDNTSLSGSSGFGIGNHSLATNDAQFQGEIMEAIVFNTVLSAQQRMQVESYLAIKYGLTLTNNIDNDGTPNEIVTGAIREGDYLAGDGGVIWNYAARGATYFNDIAGIGRDDLSCLNQTRSKSENSDAIVDVQIGSFSETDSWFVWGNDNAPMEDTRNFERPAGINSRLNREWQAQETGTVGTVTVTFDLTEITGTPTGANDLSQIRLMIDQDGDFRNGVTLVNPSSFDPFNKTVSFQTDFTNSTGYYFTLGSEELDALPIELIKFEATSLGNTVQLDWWTASETNNSFYTIERSRDGLSFEAVGELTAAGNSSTVMHYRYFDKVAEAGKYYYRIKQTDFNGQFSHGEVRGVLVEFVESSHFNIYPNPNENGLLKFNFKLDADLSKLELTVFSTSGEVMIQEQLKPNSEEGAINISGLVPGIYFVRLKTINTSVTKRLIVK